MRYQIVRREEGEEKGRQPSVREADRRAERHTGREAGRQAGRQAGREAHRQRGRQTGRQADGETDRRKALRLDGKHQEDAPRGSWAGLGPATGTEGSAGESEQSPSNRLLAKL